MRRLTIVLSIQAALFTCLPIAALAQSAPPAPGNEVRELDTVQVTGSRIPRAQLEGPAPVTVMTAEDIRANGFVSVPDVLRAMTQNGGETQSQQSASGADFSPGAQQVDLRGLGPNHTLVLVNGRRIADFPMPFKGRSNFTDISNIPLGMVERIEVLTGSASAVYGSDAISGVVNFILKKEADGFLVDYRYGGTELGGGESHKLSLSGGFGRGGFNAVYGVELLDQRPLWARDRKIQDSTKDAPTESARAARRAFLRTDWWDDYIDPGEATCQGLTHLNDGTTYYALRPRWGYYCGSDEAIGYGTIISERRGANAYVSLSHQLSENTEWFADLQLGNHKLRLFRDVTQWWHMDAQGNEEGYFFNQATDQIEYWQRQFSPEEMGGLDNGQVRNDQKTFSLTSGFKGTLGSAWDYEAAFSHSQYHATISWAQIVAARANALFLGPQLGTDADGYPIYDADPTRLYTPLTRAEYDSIAARSVYKPKSRSDTLSFTLTHSDLFELKGGPAGFASIIEYGDQSYSLNPDPRALEYYYLSWKDSDGRGDRKRWAVAGELRAPLLETLTASLAARYDDYRFGGAGSDSKPTYSAGLEWRPLQSLLLRGSYGTAFRAPDLHYVFSGPGNLESSVDDVYRCAIEEPDVPLGDCSYSGEGVIVSRDGNRNLQSETSKSWTAGLVWSPTANLDFSVDYFDIDMRNKVEDLSLRTILEDEARCRLGELDISTSFCQDRITRVRRYPATDPVNPNGLIGVHTNPINIGLEKTSGVDVSAQLRIPTAVGEFRFAGNHTWVRDHVSQEEPSAPLIDQLAYDSGYYIPRTKSSASLSYNRNGLSTTLHGQRLGRLPNYGEDAWMPATYRYNATVSYKFTDFLQLGLSVTNLFNKMPPKDPSYTAYPYYDISWFDSLGRSYYLQMTYKFGGNPL